jgi:hypothetical protein
MSRATATGTRRFSFWPEKYQGNAHVFRRKNAGFWANWPAWLPQYRPPVD